MIIGNLEIESKFWKEDFKNHLNGCFCSDVLYAKLKYTHIDFAIQSLGSIWLRTKNWQLILGVSDFSDIIKLVSSSTFVEVRLFGIGFKWHTL
jgi:hypothetical protein